MEGRHHGPLSRASKTPRAATGGIRGLVRPVRRFNVQHTLGRRRDGDRCHLTVLAVHLLKPTCIQAEPMHPRQRTPIPGTSPRSAAPRQVYVWYLAKSPGLAMLRIYSTGQRQDQKPGSHISTDKVQVSTSPIAPFFSEPTTYQCFVVRQYALACRARYCYSFSVYPTPEVLSERRFALSYSTESTVRGYL